MVKRGLVLLFILGIFFAFMTTIALAAGYTSGTVYYNDALYPQGPHGGYTTSTNKCKECHAVHLAQGSYRLTRVNSASQTCDFCHAHTGYASMQVSLNVNGHGIDQTTSTPDPVVSPDDSTPTPYTIARANWSCASCHSVHANPKRMVWLADEPTNRLLIADPNPAKNGAYLYYNTSLINTSTGQSPQKLATWCSACHNTNLGSHKTAKQYWNGTSTINVYSHDSSETSTSLDANGYALSSNGYQSPDYPVNNGPNCKQCHPADGGYTFPHSSTGPNLLMSTVNSSSTNLDVACINCHNTTSMP